MYHELKDRESKQDKGGIEASLKLLNEIEEKFNQEFDHPLAESLRNLYSYKVLNF